MLELLRALNWMIRADVPWPTKRGQNFDFVLVGEPGVFALWVYDGDPEGVEEAAAGLGALLNGVRVRPVVCRGFASLGHAHPEVLYCTPETALDLLIGLPAHEDQAAIRAIASRLRDLVVPPPPEPEPEPEPAPPVAVVEPPKPVPPKVEPPKPTPPAVKVEPSKPTPPAVKVALPPTPAPVPVSKPAPAAAPVVRAPIAPVTPKPVVKATPPPQAAPVPKPESRPKPKPEPTPPPKAAPQPVKTPTPAKVPVVEAAPAPAPEPARPLPAGRHRSERPRFPRRTPPPPPAVPATGNAKLPKSTIELPTALTPAPGRVRGGNNAAERFDNTYVYVPEPVQGPGPLKREFRAKPFLVGIVVLIMIAAVAALGVREWPQLAGLAKSDSNPSATFGQTITTNTTNFHPNLKLSMTLPQRVGTSRGSNSYAVDITMTNVGSATWPLPARSAFAMVDSLGEAHALASISGVGSTKWAGSLRPTQSWSGRLVFVLRSGRTPLRLRFALAVNGSDTATWHN